MGSDVKYQVESYKNCKADIELLLPGHYAEVKLNTTEVRFAYNDTLYEELEQNNQLIIVTARLFGEIIGYHVSFVKFDHHSVHSMLGIVDCYYVLPKFRIGFIGIKLLKFAEERMKERGVIKVYCSASKHMHTDKLFQYLKYTEEETLFSKII